jgi:hypothetical protein
MASANLGPVPYFTVQDANGNPVSGAKINTYVAGTSTPAATYTDRTAGTPNANPVVCDSAGRAVIFFDDSVVYKLVITDASDVAIKTVDNFSVNPVIAKATTLTISGNGTIGGTFGVTGAQTNSSTMTATRFISNIATGTAPVSVTSTTPCTNVHAYPVAYNHDNSDAQAVLLKWVYGASTLSGGTATVTLTGSAVFSGSSAYLVFGSNTSNANAFKIVNSSGTQFTITGTGTDTIKWVALGS